jgi:glycosyltransferase involved in cell wall biosynthesis
LKRILFITAHRQDRAPNQRFRFEQYIAFLNRNGFECVVSPLIATAQEDRIFYFGALWKKMALGIKMAGRRWRDVARADSFDIIFIAREAFMTGTTFFERRFAGSGAKIVFDFDDSIWIDVVSTSNKLFSWLKNASKTGKIISLADLVFAGNDYLANYALKFNDNVTVIPTTIDTDLYYPQQNSNQKIIIGWSGSVSTIEHFEHAVPALKILQEQFGSQVDFRIIGDGSYRNEELHIAGHPWRFETELYDLHGIDIGIMPLPNDQWTRGKCGLKGLQYMALGIPCIMSPVGVNTAIIEDGINGFLAGPIEEWVEKISLLIRNPDLRQRLGAAGRATVVRSFSVQSQQQRYLDALTRLVS